MLLNGVKIIVSRGLMEHRGDIQFLYHPRIGGSRGYDIPLSQMMVESYQVGGLPLREGRARRWGGRRRKLG
jgi:hypothetical protein